MSDLDHSTVDDFAARLRAAKEERLRSGIPSWADRVKAVKPLTAMERKAAADEIDASFDRIKARWAAENPNFGYEPISDADDAPPEPEPTKARGNRRPLIFRERDIKRAIAGHMKAGLSVQRTEIDASGRIVIVTGSLEPTSVAPVNEWDTVK